MLRSPKFVWATCLAALILTTSLVFYTSTQSMSIQLRFSITPTTSNVATTTDKEEKFITFLPHSGLHNQRIGLINAMILAKTLDRTLILPAINVGSAISWKPTPLSEFRLSECPSIKQRSNPKCRDFKKYVPISVETIFDLSAAHSVGIRTVQRLNMSPSYYNDVYGWNEQDIYRIDDNDRYSYRIYDTPDNQDSIRTFRYRINMDDLQQRDEKIIVFGSLHYTLRLAMQDPKMVWLAKFLREETSISHPTVIKQALSVLPLLGGPEKFVGVHLRQGDGFFKKLMDETLNTLRATLEQSTLKPELSTMDQQQLMAASVMTRPLSSDEEDMIDMLKEVGESSPETVIPLLNKCVQLHSEDNHPRLRLIFMATDTRQPRTTLKELYDEFPCIFTLSDFPGVIESTLTMGPMLTGDKDLDEEATRLGSSIASLLIPMIDAEIASHGSSFIGTRKSTFSQYINHRFNRFQTLYHTTS
ncbi:uncharacterized protein EV154DRAFT_554006 [Mucor mucedo]|uniref:uncharacterized protein n=1 Tax=Mucor mucedo TaxID=29922 RepID=UPI00221EE010|nr:uncharacterized protein EV154DRAFT_554006 [Mucor mucedo]KAI7888223.1 hypothetical protein EV154DRAFT_554006 [Mucor mucedo]